MNLKNSVKTFSHILIWLIVLVVPIYFMSRSGTFQLGFYLSYVIRIGIIGILFYINYLYLIDKLLFERKTTAYIVINIILIAILIILQNMLLELHMDLSQAASFDMNRPPQRRPRPPFFMRMFTDYLLIVFVIGLSVAIKMTTRWYKDSINLEKVKNMQLEADLRNLRNQLNPHFLFNTLNNIYSLIAIDRHKAQDSVHRLSNLLRYVLYENDRKFVPLDKEFEFTQNYIDLMKLRLTSNVKVNVLIENKDCNNPIASLMFMTLIENAFKHGLNNGDNSFVDVKILVEKDKGVICTVENSLPASDRKIIKDKSSGIGLINLNKRLELLYPNKHEFNIEKRDNKFIAFLRINF